MQIKTKKEEAQIAGFYYRAHKQGKITREEGRRLTDYLDRFIRATTVRRSIRYWYDGFVGLGNSRGGHKVIFLIVGRKEDEIKPLVQLSVPKEDLDRVHDCFHDYLSRLQ